MPQEPSHPKLLCAHRVLVMRETTNPAQAKNRKQSAILEEISVQSATLYTECPMRTGSRVVIDCSSCELRGKVIGCERQAAGYLAAVRLDEDSPWSKATFAPEGLLNPKYLECDKPGCSPDCDSTECCGGSKSDLDVCV